MDESALERFFDNFIANDSWKMKTEEVKTEMEDELSSHPDDEQLTAISTDQDNNSQNATAAAELAGGSSSLAASLVLPMSPVRPEARWPQIIPQIQNVSATMKLGCCLDLKTIARKAWNVQFDPQVHNALFMRIRKPKTTAIIHKTGNIICTGAKSVEDSRLAARKFARKIQKLGFPIRPLTFRIQNIMASCTSFPLDLLRLAQHHDCSYEPELFNGLVYSRKSGITATIFCSGKLNLTGVKTEAEIQEALDALYPILNSCRRQ